MTIIKLKDAFSVEEDREAYIECFFCKKEFKCNPKKSVYEEAKKHNLWLLTIRSPDNYEEDREEVFVCNDCYNKIFVRRVSLKEFREKTKEKYWK